MVDRPLAVGIQLPEVEREVSWPELRDMALAAEAVGFDSIWVGDHLLYRTDAGLTGPWEAWSLLAALAAVTERVRLGPLVTATSFHNPAVLAKKAATVDEIADGRLILGLGAGWNEPEYLAFGFPYDHRLSRFGEAFTIIRTLLRQGAIDFDGEYYTARHCELVPPPRPGGPPLMIGSTGPKMLRLTLPYVDMWNVWHAWYGNTPDGFATVNATIDIACREVGRDPAEVGRTTTVYWQFAGGTGRTPGNPDRPDAEALTGSSEQLATTLRLYADAGADHVQLVLDPITIRSIETAAEAIHILDAG
ncbi:MAG: LLM class flavin-dependent oxidoreductase [Acidimicrobiia bacterium]|nr:MAG: LLM class flavin-dependent oxidoreductase [Acidimicrobiia bacterium]